MKKEVKYCDYCAGMLFNGEECRKCDKGESAIYYLSTYIRATINSKEGYAVSKERSDEIAGNILALVRDMLPKMSQSSESADKHFTCDYEELDSLYQHEWEGISWGFQDCVTLINQKFGAEKEVRQNIEKLKTA